MSDKETKQLIHELQVHQIELEMQNEELRKAQAELEESRAKYSDIYDFAPVGYFTFDKHGLILEVNLTGAIELGIEKSGLINKPFRAYIVTKDRNIFDEHLHKVLNTENRQTCEMRLKKKNGSEFYAQLESIAVNDVKGNTLYRTSLSEITDRRQSEDALKKSEQRYRNVYNTAPLAFVLWDRETRITDWNNRAEQMFGWTSEEIVGQNFFDYIIPESARIHVEEIVKLLLEGRLPSYSINENVTKSGQIIVCEWNNSITRDSDGNVVGVISLGLDITERKQAEEALQKSEEKYHTVADFTYDWEDWLDPSGKYIYVSPSFERITGYRRDELLNMDMVLKITHPDDREAVKKHFHEELHDSIGIHDMDFRIITRSADERWISHLCQPVYSKKGTYLGRRGSNRDITKRKEAEQKLKQLTDELARSNEDLKQFASAASHDLQEPLRGIESFIRLLEKRYKGKLDEKADEYLDYVVNDVKRMQLLIKDLLEYSRVSVKGKAFSPVNCSVALEQALHNLRSALEESGAKVTYDLLPTVMGDEAQLSSLFQNLIGNAIKFRGKEPLKIHISANREGNEWIFSIRDNGIGIDPEQAERIFTIFQRLHSRQEYPGTGVGLAICKKIVERHGGRIWVESEHKKGSNFFFAFPAL